MPNVASESSMIIETNTDTHDTAVEQDVIPDCTVDEGDEHTRQITGAPQCCITPHSAIKNRGCYSVPSF